MSSNSERIDKYELQECLGRNGIEVWKAFDTQAQRSAIIKLLRGNLQTDPEFVTVVTNFQRNMPILVSLRHPHIVQYYDFSVSQRTGTASAVMYLVMEYVEGDTLANSIRNASYRPAP